MTSMRNGCIQITTALVINLGHLYRNRNDYHEIIFETFRKPHTFFSYLNGRLRTATLRRQYDSQAVLIICLLRAYLLGKHYEAAAMLVSKVSLLMS